MSQKELKDTLIAQIVTTDDEALLREVTRLLNLQLKDEDRMELSDDQIHAIQKALKQVEEGETLSEEEANQQIEEWLGK